VNVCRSLVGFFFFLSAAGCVFAANEPPAFSRRVWQSADGLPEDFVQALARTGDGYLWIGTSGGLVKFDGVRFTLFNRENQAALHDDSIYALLSGRDGSLWIGTEGGGLVRYLRGEFHAFGSGEGLTSGFVRVLYEDHAGTLWVGTDNGLFRMEQGRLVRVDGQNGIPQMMVHAISEDGHGNLLFGGEGMLVLGSHGAAYFASKESAADNSVRTIVRTSDGTIWVGTISGLRKLENWNGGNTFLVPRILNGNVCVMLESHTRDFWVGTYGTGVFLYRGGKMQQFSAPVLPHNNVLSLLDDGEGDIWIGTQGGLLRLSPSAAVTANTADGTPQSINTIYQDPSGTLFVAALNGRLYRVTNQMLTGVDLPPGAQGLPVRNVFRDSTGALWMGTDGQGALRISDAGSGRLANSPMVRFSRNDGMVNDFVRAFAEDRDGGIWIGTDGGLSRWKNGQFQNFGLKSGLVYESIRSIYSDRDGNVWVGTDGGLSRYANGTFSTPPALDQLRGQKIWAIHQDSGGSLWFGTHGAGLFFLKDGQLVQFTPKQGLPSSKIHYITEDNQDNLWMSTPSGIVSVARRDLESLASEDLDAQKQHRRPERRQVAFRVFGISEGLSTNQMNGGVQPAGAVTPSGEFWFPSAKGAVCIGHEMPEPGRASPVLVEQALADGRDVPFDGGLKLAPGNGKLEIQYTAIRLRSPETIRFKYWLENLDPDWTDAGQRRIAYYTNVPAGDYRFHVIAYEINDPRVATEQILSIHWQPHFYQTRWFVGLCVLALLSAVAGAYFVHVRNLGKRFAAVLEERNRLAREMHDTLIQGCVGVSALLEAASRAQDVSPAISHELVDRARDEVRAAVDEARLAVWNLRQGSGSGEDLVRSVSELASRTSLETGIPIHFSTSGAPFALGAEGERSLLMMIREAITNALRHAAPTNVTVSLMFDRESIEARVEDNGCGFDPARVRVANGAGHYGLIGMRERVEKLGGEYSLDSAPGKGTRVRLRIPSDHRPAPQKL
jgi:ligand-binding sensor domain-containing protein/signal transduction histidine kinase